MIFEYIKGITLIALFLALVELILPSQKFAKYIQLVLGFVLMVNIVLPFVNFKEYSFELKKLDFESFLYQEFDEDIYIEASNSIDNIAIVNGVKQEIIINNQLETFEIVDVFTEYIYDDDVLVFTNIDLLIREKLEENREGVEVIKIDKINIDGIKKEKNEIYGENEEIMNLKNKISMSYNMSIDSINVNIENY